ncbi:MAG TPA: cysteine peptidase family C39 domain-containing protein [Bryobacteraceae bacterium]|nr:cysteine peptidase family C39 domain-containing protein [Bryobacteraceae bacterium]
MSAAQLAIPYERQSEAPGDRTCGAVCLGMIYRSFGKEVSQEEIWAAIAKRNRFGSLASTTHLMVQDALKRGCTAVAIQARYPLQVLRLCRENGIRGIVNHRSSREASTGHYSVLVDIDDKIVVTHDPSLGPARRLSHAALMELWQPALVNSEIIGNVLIAIGAAGAPKEITCEFCHMPIPAEVPCPRCKNPVILRPSSVLGCLSETCIARMWNYICCPACDYTWNFHLQPGNADATASISAPAAANPDAGPQKDPWNLDRVFGELDKFCKHILSLPSVANRADIKAQLDFLQAGKEKLKLAQAEQFAHHKARAEQLTTLKTAAEVSAEAHRKKLEELKTPLPPLDGNALGRALLKNLGFIA